AGRNDVRSDRLGAFGGHAAGLDDRLDIGAGEISKLFGNLLAALDEILAALVRVGEKRLERRERRNGLEAVKEIVIGHSLNPFLGRSSAFARCGTNFAAGRLAAARYGLLNNLLGHGLNLRTARALDTLTLGDSRGFLPHLLGGRGDSLGNPGGSLGRRLGLALGS